MATILILFGFLLPNFLFAEGNNQIQTPGNIEKIKELGEKAIGVGKEALLGTLERIWKEEVLPIWQKMYDWTKTKLWEPYIWPWFKKIWQIVLKIFGQEVEKRKPAIEEEFKKEKEEMKQEVPKVGQSLWEKFKEIIK